MTTPHTLEQCNSREAEHIADMILRAAGSGFQHYMPESKKRIIEAAKQALSQHTRAAAPLREAWQPIETAPKDTTLCLVGFWEDCPSLPYPIWTPSVAAYQRVDFNEGVGEPPRLGWMPIGEGGNGEWHELHPTHWMPLPKPPASNPAPATEGKV